MILYALLDITLQHPRIYFNDNIHKVFTLFVKSTWPIKVHLRKLLSEPIISRLFCSTVQSVSVVIKIISAIYDANLESTQRSIFFRKLTPHKNLKKLVSKRAFRCGTRRATARALPILLPRHTAIIKIIILITFHFYCPPHHRLLASPLPFKFPPFWITLAQRSNPVVGGRKQRRQFTTAEKALTVVRFSE